MIARYRTVSRTLALACCIIATAAATPAQESDVVVQARRLRDWRADLIVGKGDAVTCRIVRSTGDAALDAMACDDRKRCFETMRPRITATHTGSPAVRKRLLALVNRDLARCFDAVSMHYAIYPLDPIPSPASGSNTP